MYARKRTARIPVTAKSFKTTSANGHKRRYQAVAQRRKMASAVVAIGPPSSPIEKKFLDTALSDATLASAMTFNNICVIPQGDTESQRTGRRVTVTAIMVRGSLTLLGATDVTNTSTQVRMRIICDTQTNGAQFAATDLLESDAINSFANLANRSRFVVICDKLWNLSAGGASATGAAYAFSERVVPIEVYKQCSIPIEYDNSVTTGAIGSVRSNSLWVVFQCSTGEIIASSATCRIRYTDA